MNQLIHVTKHVNNLKKQCRFTLKYINVCNWDPVWSLKYNMYYALNTNKRILMGGTISEGRNLYKIYLTFVNNNSRYL